MASSFVDEGLPYIFIECSLVAWQLTDLGLFNIEINFFFKFGKSHLPEINYLAVQESNNME